jgi:hypothetical protein
VEGAAPEPERGLIIIPASALDTLTRAEIETQIASARKFRRSLARFRSEALSMATLDQETAAACSYAIPRDGKIIDGPSIRLAEICLATWGNLRAGARLIDEGEGTVTAQGFCHDLESNTAITMEVRRRIKDRFGRRYSEDMITLTGNAACAIALRNVTFRVIPQVFVEQIRQAALKIAAGSATTLDDRRQKAVGYFIERGVPLERVLARLSEFTEQPKAGIEDLDVKDMAILHGFATSLKDGVATIEELFATEAPKTSRAGQLADELKGKSKGKKEEK